MPEKANVQSIQVVSGFRSKLCVFVDKGKQSYDEIMYEINKTRTWLLHERMPFWKNQVQIRAIQLVQAREDRRRHQFSQFKTGGGTEELKLQEAKKRLREAEEKLKLVKKWEKMFENQIQPFLGKLNRLSSLIGSEMPKAIAHLGQIVTMLEGYAELKPSSDETPKQEIADNDDEEESE